MLGKGAPGAKILENSGGARRNLADSTAGWLITGAPERSAAVRIGRRFVFFPVVVTRSHSSQLGVGEGVPVARNIGGSERTRQNMENPRAGWLNLSGPSLSVSLRGCRGFPFVFCSFARPPPPPIGGWGRGCQAPEILGDSGRDSRNMVDCRAG